MMEEDKKISNLFQLVRAVWNVTKQHDEEKFQSDDQYLEMVHFVTSAMGDSDSGLDFGALYADAKKDITSEEVAPRMRQARLWINKIKNMQRE